MLKKLFTAAIVSIFVITSYSFSAQDNEAELAARNKELEKISKEITALQEELKLVKLEYVEAEKKLQREIAEKTLALTRAEKEQGAEKKILTNSKKKQTELRKDYYRKKNPLAQKINELKVAHRQCGHKIKVTEKVIQKIKEGSGPDYEYEEQIKRLKQELTELKAELDDALAKLQSEADEKLAALANQEQKAKTSKQILSEAKDKEIEIRQDYAGKKEVIAAKIDKAKSAYRERLKQRQEQRRQELALQTEEENAAKQEAQKTQGSGTTYNFGPAN